MNNKIVLIEGHIYRARKPRKVICVEGNYFDDRMLIFIGAVSVKYVGPAIKRYGKLHSVSLKSFLSWADRDITDELMPGEYAIWGIKKGSSI